MTLSVRLLSDLHLEFGNLEVPVVENENDQVLVLAGDIGLADKPHTYIPFLEEMGDRFQDVIYIMGNHEFYGSSFFRARDKIKEQVFANGSIQNVHTVNNEIVRIGDTSFVCSTMWASYDNGSPLTMYEANLWMNDHRKVRTGTPNDPYKRKFTAEDAYQEFLRSKDYIFSAIGDRKQNGHKVVVVTHHAPSWESVHVRYMEGANSKLNGAYASNLDYNILDTQPNVWVHGHTHVSFDYMIGDTRVVCNPRGYFGVEENPSFDPTLIISI